MAGVPVEVGLIQLRISVLLALLVEELTTRIIANTLEESTVVADGVVPLTILLDLF